MEPILTEDLPYGFTLEIYYDDYCENPREMFDHAATMAILSDGYKGIGDKNGDKALLDAIRESKYYKDAWDESGGRYELDLGYYPDLKKALIRCKDIYVLPIFIYDHSGITINTTGFSCKWDSGLGGIIFITRERYMKEMGVKRVKVKDVEKLLKTEVEEMDDYLTGQCYGYILRDPDGEDVDSCWGFIGDIEYAKASGLENVDYYTRLWMENIPGQLP